MAACLVLASGQAVAATDVTISNSQVDTTPVSSTYYVGIWTDETNTPKHVTIINGGSLTIKYAGVQINGGDRFNGADGQVYVTPQAAGVPYAGSSLTVDGGSLRLENAGKWFEVGRINEGHATVQNGGTAYIAGWVGIGAWASTTGTNSSMTVTGTGSTLTAIKGVAVGDSGNGRNGAGVLNITDGGKVITEEIYTDNTSTYGEVNINGGILEVTKAGNIFRNFNTTTGTNPDKINIGDGGATLITSASGDYTQSSTAAISGTGALTKEGAGNLIFEANNTYTGDTIINEGTLQAGNGGTTGTFGTGDISVASGATVGINRSDNYEVQNVINGADGGILRKQGDGTATFAKAVTVSKTLIDDGTLVAGTNYNGGDVTVGNNVEGEATANLQINVGQTSTINSVVINTDGKTTNEGTLNVGGGSGSITVNGGTLASSGTTTAGTLTVNQGVKEGGAVRSGEVNVTGGTTTATTTDIQDGTVTVSDGAKLSGGEIKVGNGDGTAASDSAGLVVNGEVEATSVTVKNDGTVDVGTTGKLGTETSAIPTVNVDGGTLNSSGTTNATTLTADNGGKVNVNGGTTTATTLNVNNDGAVKVNAGTADITTTNINDGAVAVAAGATLDSDTLNVGNGEEGAGTATLTNAGTVTADNVTVKSDGQLDNNGTLGDTNTAITVDGGTLNSTGTTNANTLTADNSGKVNVNGGTTTATTLNVNNDGAVKVNAGTADITTTNIKDGSVAVAAGATLDSDTLNVGDGSDSSSTATLTNAGTVNADNVTVKSDGQLDNNGTLGDTNTAITVDGGTLNSTGTTNANTLTADNSGKVNVNGGTTTATTLNVNNDGAVKVNAGTADITTTNIKDGSVAVAAGATLDSDTLNVGNGEEGAGTATLTNAGTVNADNVTVKSDGQLDNNGTLGDTNTAITVDGGTLNSTGTTNANTLTADNSGKVNVNGGTTTATTLNVNNDGVVKVDAGKADITTTNIKDGAVAVAAGATLDSDTLNVGDGSDSSGTATLTNAGTVASDIINVSADGNLTNTGALTADTALNVDGGSVALNDGSITTPETNINAGTVNVGTDGTLDSDTLNVGDGTDGAGTAALTNAGTVASDIINVNKDGNLTNTGELTADTALNVDGGTVALDDGTITTPETNINAGTVNVGADGTLDAGKLTVGDGTDGAGTAALTNEGTVNADNVTVKSDGQLDNNGTLGDTETNIAVEGGTLNSTGTTNANTLTVDNDGKVNVNDGTTDVGTTNINDGTVSVGANGTLDSDTLNVGDGTDSAGTAALTNAGTVASDIINVNKDGNLTNTGELTADTALNVDGGSVALNDGSITTPETNINAGTVNVGTDGTLDSDTLNVGDGTDGAGTAALTNAGTVAADTVNVKADGNLTNTGELTADTALNVDGGTVALDDGTITTPETNINAGTVNVGTDGTLDAGKLTVGDGNGDPSTASLNADGTVKATDLVANKDGNIAVNNGATVTATTSAKVAGGIIAINQGGILNSGEHGENDFVVDSGSVNVDGTLNAKNITSNPAQDSSADDAKINVGSTGTLNLKPTGDQPLFAGLDTSKGDAINVDGKLNVDVADGNTATQANTAGITGTGTLNKEGNGGLVLTAPTNTLGTVNANDGVLTVDNGSKLNANTLNVGDSDDKPATVNVNGEAAAADVNIAKDGTLNVGDASGTPAGKLAATNPISMNGGTLNVNPNATLTTPNIVSPDTADNETSTVNVANDATLNLNPTDGAKLFDGFNSAPGGKDAINLDGTLNLNVASGTVTQPVSAPISGNGTFNKEGSGTFDVKANNPFTGAVNVNDGTLQISEGGKLGNATVNVNSPATLAVDKNGTELGNLNLNGGGTLSVAATPAGYAKIQVNGDANLNNGHLFTDIAGSHEEDLENGNFANVISTPNGQIIGDFASYDDNSHLFNFVPYITDDHKAVGLTPYSVGGDHSLESISNKLGFGRAADAGRALDTIFKANPANELSRLFYTIRDDKQAANAVLESLPTLAGASSQVVADTSRHLANLAKIYDRCEDNVQQGDKHIWAKTFGSWGTQDQYQGAAGYRSESYGFAAGVEKCHQQTRLGVMMGYAYDHVRSRESVSDQRLRADTIQAGIYGNTPISSIADLDFRAGIGYSDVGTERNIKFANRTAQGNYGNKIGYAGVGVNFNAFSSEQAVIKPFIRLDYQVVRNNHYSERGAGVLNLNVDADTNQSLVSQVGVDMKARLADKFSVNTRVGVGYDLVGELASTRAAFAGAPDVKFTTKGAQHGRVSGELGIEMNYHITPAATLSVGYDASARKGYIEHTPNIMFKMAF